MIELSQRVSTAADKPVLTGANTRVNIICSAQNELRGRVDVNVMDMQQDDVSGKVILAEGCSPAMAVNFLNSLIGMLEAQQEECSGSHLVH
ncbi:hypothetical protein [Edwardsiella tarda]|jgi:hypothetical protein|uniref:hypothetical protein n=1 Tax=Edwardsiella tarda TaxID=636 RepID=UPI003081F89C|nr:hypothetical protein GBS0709_24040 [Edwardsiella tarda]